MKSMKRVFKRTKRHHKGEIAKRWSGIRARITMSYVLVHMVFVLLMVSIAWTVFFILDPHVSSSQVTTFALLIAPNGRILASSYPARYPVSSPVTRLLPAEVQLISNALAGRGLGSVVEDTSQGHVISVAQTIWSKQQKPIGVLFIQTHPEKAQVPSIWNLVKGWIGIAPAALIVAMPFGALLGLVATRSLVRCIRRLARTTTEFAAGDYDRRLPAEESDEIGQLELSFNQMADQLVESMAQRQVLIGTSLAPELFKRALLSAHAPPDHNQPA